MKSLKFILSFIKNREWVIIGTETCPYCLNAKNLLEKNNIKFTFLNLHELAEIFQMTEKDIIAELNKYTKNYKFIPMIFYNSKFIGGFDQLKTYF